MAAELVAELKRLLEAPGAGRPFLASLSGTGSGRGTTLSVHAARSAMSRQQGAQLRERLARRFGVRVKLLRHRRWTLQRARSLEAFLRPFAGGEIVFDPTGIFERGAHLVDFARTSRTADAVRSVLWHSASGSLFVVLDHRNVRLGTPHHLEIETHLRARLRGLEASAAGGFVRHVRIGFHAPRLPTTAVDARSVGGRLKAFVGLGKGAIVTSLAAGLGLGAAAARAEDASAPAVSGINSELGIMGGLHDGTGAFLVEGAVSIPVTDQLGTRWDAVVGTINGQIIGGGAGHFFWRDPDTALLGVAGGFLASDAPLVGTAYQIGVIAVEAEAYMEDLTVSGLLGYQLTGTPVDDGIVGRLDLEWYATDDLMLSAGVETNPQVDALGRLGVEYRPAFEALPGMSVFAEGAIGTQGYHRVVGGLRFYFGESDTLKSRHRNDTFRSHLLPTRMIDSVPKHAAYGN